MRRALAVLAVAVLLAGGAVFAGRRAVLVFLTGEFVRAAGKEAAAENLSVERVTYETAFEGLFTPTWRKLAASVDLSGRAGFPRGSRLDLFCEKAVLAPGGLAGGAFTLSLLGLEGHMSGASPNRGREHLVLQSLSSRALVVRFRADMLRPWRFRDRLSAVAAGMKELFSSGATALPVDFEGTAVFSYGGESLAARFGIEKHGRRRRLTARKDDLMNMAARFDLRRPVTAAEVDLLSRYPMRAARLFTLRNQARALAREAARKSRTVSTDAFRHIFWSYLLTKEYGAEFAEMVTDAHEEGRTGNSPAERAMDLQNNAVGRKYARLGYDEEAVPIVAATDREVVAQAPALGGSPSR